MTAGIRLSILAISLTLGACTAQNASIERWQHPFATWVDTTGVEQEDAEAQYERGQEYYFGREGALQSKVEAAKWYQKAAEQGHAGAQTMLGIMYYIGEGVPENYAEAAKWYRKAAEQGDKGAQTLLGGMYRTGEGVPQSDTEAVKWTRKAAEQGGAIAQFRLGQMYLSGEGVPQNKVEAYAWHVLASVGHVFVIAGHAYDKEYEAAIEAREELRKELTPAQVAAGQELAAQLYEWISARQQETEH